MYPHNLRQDGTTLPQISRSAAVVAIAFAAAACEQTGIPALEWGPCADAVRSPVVGDSAGVRIVRNLCPGLGQGWQVESAPRIQIGAKDGAPATHFVRNLLTWAVQLSDGRYAVLERRTNEVRYFTPSGGHVRTVGGTGDGPGEFRLSAEPPILLPADTLAVFDLDLRRVTVLSPTGDLVTIVEIENPDERGTGGLVVGRTLGGDYLVRTEVAPSLLEREGVRPATGTVWRRSATSGDLLALVSYPGQLQFVGAGVGPFPVPLPFAQQPWIGLWNDRIVVVDRSAYDLRLHREDGSLERIVRRDVGLIPVSNDDVKSMREARIRRLRDQYQDWMVPAFERMYERPEIPDVHASVAAVLTDRVGNLWVGFNEPEPGPSFQWRVSVTPTTWSVFDADGVWMTDVRIPDGLRVTDIGHDYVLGVWEDELGVPYIREYALVKN